MHSWVPFPFLRITLLFASGIIVAEHFPPYQYRVIILSGLVTLFFTYLFLLLKLRRFRFFRYNLVFSGTVHLMIFLAGYTSFLFHNHSQAPDHILHTKGVSAYQILVKDQPEHTLKTIRVLGKVIKIRDHTGWRTTSGKINISIEKDELNEEVAYGDIVLISGYPDLIQKPKNPGQFDYRKYLSLQNIYHQDFIKSGQYHIVAKNKGNVVYKAALESRAYLKNIIYKHIQSERERAIAMALLLGNREKITPAISDAYISSGAMHILAVSGLHVGILYGVLLFLFRSTLATKRTSWLFLILTLLALWGYAMITGLSPSVLRAATMFSFISIAKVAKRDINIYNTLSAAGLILLCIDPYMILHVGFQLSFLAVFGIVYITPKIYGLIVTDHYLADKIWMMVSVSIAAQIATLPLTILYFHRLPTYSFITNLVAVPSAFLILVTGILLFAVHFVPDLSDLIGKTLEVCIYIINEFVFLVKKIPYHTVDNLYIDSYQSVLMLTGIVIFFIWRHYRRISQLVILYSVIVVFTLVGEARAYENIRRKEVVFYSIPKHYAIDLISGTHATLIADTALVNDLAKLQFYISPKRLSAGIKALPGSDADMLVNRRKIDTGELIVWNGLRVLNIRHAKIPAHFEAEVDVILISNNAVEDISLLKNIEAKYIILDGTNSRQAIRRLLKQNALANDKPTMIDLMSEGAYSILL